MSRISACAPLLLSAALAWSQQPQNFGQNPPSPTPPAYGSPQASPQAKPAANSPSQNDLQGAVRACAALLLAATSAKCAGDASQQPASHPNSVDRTAPNSQNAASQIANSQNANSQNANSQNANSQNPNSQSANSPNQGDLQGTLRSCAVLLMAATSRKCPEEDASNPPPPQPAPTPARSQDRASMNSQIQSTLQSALNSDPGLTGANVEVSVDDVNITLTGSVQAQGQINRVLALASPYADYRTVVNKVGVH